MAHPACDWEHEHNIKPAVDDEHAQQYAYTFIGWCPAAVSGQTVILSNTWVSYRAKDIQTVHVSRLLKNENVI